MVGWSQGGTLINDYLKRRGGDTVDDADRRGGETRRADLVLGLGGNDTLVGGLGDWRWPTLDELMGLGISTADQVREVLEYADGAIVGTALVRALTDGGPQAVGTLTRELAAGVREPRR